MNLQVWNLKLQLKSVQKLGCQLRKERREGSWGEQKSSRKDKGGKVELRLL